jgi:hypothetical protein
MKYGGRRRRELPVAKKMMIDDGQRFVDVPTRAADAGDQFVRKQGGWRFHTSVCASGSRVAGEYRPEIDITIPDCPCHRFNSGENTYGG